MNARNVLIIAVASTTVALGGIAWAWRSAPSEETLACDGNQHNDIESEKDECREFQTHHGPGETRGENKVIADLEDDRGKGYACKDCPSAFGLPCEKEVGSSYDGFDWLPDEDDNYWRWKVKNLTVWVKCHTCD